MVKDMEIFSRRAALYVLSMLALIGLLATAVFAYVEEDEDENVGVYSWAWAYVKGDVWWDEETQMWWVTCLERAHEYWISSEYPYGCREIIYSGDPPVGQSQPHSADARTTIKIMGHDGKIYVDSQAYAYVAA